MHPNPMPGVPESYPNPYSYVYSVDEVDEGQTPRHRTVGTYNVLQDRANCHGRRVNQALNFNMLDSFYSFCVILQYMTCKY